ncbi:GNVR domain-containing protein [Shigella flexneri]
MARRTCDVESGQQVYELLNNEQELKITKASTVGDVRIVDPAITQPGGGEAEESADCAGGACLPGLMLSIVGVCCARCLTAASKAAGAGRAWY